MKTKQEIYEYTKTQLHASNSIENGIPKDCYWEPIEIESLKQLYTNLNEIAWTTTVQYQDVNDAGERVLKQASVVITMDDIDEDRKDDDSNYNWENPNSISVEVFDEEEI